MFPQRDLCKKDRRMEIIMLNNFNTANNCYVTLSRIIISFAKIWLTPVIQLIVMVAAMGMSGALGEMIS